MKCHTCKCWFLLAVSLCWLQLIKIMNSTLNGHIGCPAFFARAVKIFGFLAQAAQSNRSKLCHSNLTPKVPLNWIYYISQLFSFLIESFQNTHKEIKEISFAYLYLCKLWYFLSFRCALVAFCLAFLMQPALCISWFYCK